MQVTKQSHAIVAAVAAAGMFILTACGAEQDASVGEQPTPSHMEQQLWPGYTVVQIESPVSSLSSKQVNGTCGQGLKVLGAGWEVLDSTGAILEGRATYFGPSWNGDGWMVNAELLSTFTNVWKLRLQLMCAYPPRGYEVITGHTALSSWRNKQISLQCPTGKVALGAGWGLLSSSNSIMDGRVTHFGPSWNATGWLINAENLSSWKSYSKLEGKIICAWQQGVPSHQMVTAETPLDQNSWAYLDVQCPVGKTASSAGYELLNGTNAIAAGEATYTSGSYNGDGWLTLMDKLRLSTPTKLRVRLICL